MSGDWITFDEATDFPWSDPLDDVIERLYGGRAGGSMRSTVSEAVLLRYDPGAIRAHRRRALADRFSQQSRRLNRHQISIEAAKQRRPKE